MTPDVAAAVAAELRLLEPAVRADPAALERLLHPDFTEIGVSGRVWDRASIVEAMLADPSVTGRAEDVRGHALAADVVLVTYRMVGGGTRLRSSVWVREDGHGWRVRFHQGTPAG